MKATPILPAHQEFLDEHFGVSSKWKQFRGKLRSPRFVEAVLQDTRTDRKLKRFTKAISLRKQTKQKGLSVPGSGSRTYKIKYHPETKRFSCSCPDWTYKRSVRNRGHTGECKHIKGMKASMRATLEKRSSVANLLRAGFQMGRQERMSTSAQKEKIRHKAYKEHFPRPNIVSAIFELHKKAAIRGLAAQSVQGVLTQPPSAN